MTTFMNLRAAFAAVFLSGASVYAGSSATQTVTFSVTALNEISVSGSPGTMTVSTGIAGAAPTSVADSSAFYAITTNASNGKITAAIDAAMPTGVTLAIDLAAPTGATSAGRVSLGTTAADVITGVARLNESGKGITYTLSATAAAERVDAQSRTVTLTVTAGAL